jgi:hypothetical protein
MILESRNEEDLRRQVDDLGHSLSSIRTRLADEMKESVRIGAVLDAAGRAIPSDIEVRS